MTDEPLIDIHGHGQDHLVISVRERHPDHLEVTVDSPMRVVVRLPH